MKYLLAVIIFCLCSGSTMPACAQTIYHFKDGLASGSAHRYGREALVADTLAYTLHMNQLKTPEADKVWYQNAGKQKAWTSVKADEAGFFRNPAMNNGYLYLTYASAKVQTAILRMSGHFMVYVNGEAHAGDQYNLGYMHLPIQLKKGVNEFYVRCGFTGRMGGIKASLETGGKPLRLSGADSTIPYLITGQKQSTLWAGIVCINNSNTAHNNLTIQASAASTKQITTLPGIPAVASRKVPVQLPVPAHVTEGTPVMYKLTLLAGNKVVDTFSLSIPVVAPHQHQSHTFISQIDGSVQYYAVAPQAGGPTPNPSLFFSVHGAGVEAIGQARAYKPKAEGPLVAPTNRRPRGFNWEDWGRLDALEVLQIAKDRYHPNADHIYLTGHSMGGHGTWYLGATYAGQWAAIAPCAGYPVLQQYGSADGLIPTSAQSAVRQQMLRASNPSNVLEMVHNYKAAGVYIFHGDDDRTVSVNYARQMRKLLADFHPDFGYYEYPGGSHWFGDISVDWPPLFDFFRSHTAKRSTHVHQLDFTTASPGIGHSHYWIQILQQEKSFAYSNVKIQRDTVNATIAGTTSNVQTIFIYPDAFAAGQKVKLTLDGQNFELPVNHPDKAWGFTKSNGQWQVMREAGVPAHEKNPQRSGGFKEAFNHQMVFVYGTKGTAQENAWALQKARYDAETWYYRGNGAVDVIPDTQFEATKYNNRGVILYGNATTNSAYPDLLQGCPVVLQRNELRIGATTYKGEALGTYFMWPRPGTTHAAVAVIGGTGIAGMRAADANQYFAGGSGFPDFMVFTADMLMQGEIALKVAGFYNHKWELGTDWLAQ